MFAAASFPYLHCGRLFFLSSRRRHTRFDFDWSSDVCSSDLRAVPQMYGGPGALVMAEEPIQIKRYPNRRFYARNTSKYVSLPEIEEMIRQGRTVDVVDSQTGESITHAVLTQIILERQPEKMSLFPIAMLHSIVRSNEAMTDFLRDYFRHSLTYLDYLQQHGTVTGGLPNPVHWVK